MAKSEIPNIVVQSGGSSCNSESRNSEMENHTNRSANFIKRDEKMDEACSIPSPVTIHIEDRDCIDNNFIENGQNDNEIVSLTNEFTENKMKKNHVLRHMCYEHKSSSKDEQEIREKVQKFGIRSSRVKLLVRSQAIQDDTSPPPELDTVIANNNMLSVNNPLYSQSQSRTSVKQNQLGKQGSSQSSNDGSSSSLSRDSSIETYTDATGIDLQQFIIETLHKNQKDRLMLMKLEQEFVSFIRDTSRMSYKFPQMSSYNRMLVHRIAAFFGLEHNVDHSGTAIIVNRSKNTRIPDFKFSEQIRDDLVHEEPKKSILKRDNASFEDSRERINDKQFLDSRRSKSFEEREELYEKAKARIFKKEDQNFIQSEGVVILSHSQEALENEWMKINSDNSKYSMHNCQYDDDDDEDDDDNDKRCQNEGKDLTNNIENNHQQNNLQSDNDCRPPMMKSHSFGGISVLISENSSTKENNTITKAESFNTTVVNNDISDEDHNNISSSPLIINSPVLKSVSEKITNSKNLPSLPFAIVGPQPQISLQQPSSQASDWTDVNKEQIVSSVTSSINSKLQNNSIISSRATEPSIGTTYIKVDEITEKKSSNSNSQAVMFTPFQSVLAPPLQVVAASNQAASNTATGTIYQQQYIPAVVYIPYISTQNQIINQTVSAQQRSNQPENQSSNNVGDLINQITNLNFNAQSSSNVSSEDNTTSPQGYPAVKSQNNMGQQGHSLEPSFCYIAQGTPGIFPIQCLHPSSTGIIQVNNTSGIVGSGTSQHNSGDNSQTVQSDTNATCLSNCNTILLPQTGNTIGMPFYSCASGFQPSVMTSTSALYQYPAMTISNVNPSNSSQVQQNSSLIPSPPQIPLVSNSSSNLTSFMLAGTTLSHHSTNIQNSPYDSFRPQTPPIQNIAVQSRPVAAPPNFNYALYSSIRAQNSNSLKSPNMVPPSNHAFARPFPPIRQSIPLMGNIPNNTPTSLPPSSRFASLSSANKNQGNFTGSKGDTKIKHGSNNSQNSQKGTKNSQLPLGTHFLPTATNFSSMYCRNYHPSLPDIQYVGHPLQHTFNSLLMSQQHQTNSRRQSKSRRHRDKTTANKGGSSNNNMQDSKAGNNVLKVEGLPEGMKRTEMERYLEFVTNSGGKIQFVSIDGNPCTGNDFIVGPKHQVLAVFESNTIAQSALLNIKTNKFQLRPLCRKDRNNSLKNH